MASTRHVRDSGAVILGEEAEDTTGASQSAGGLSRDWLGVVQWGDVVVELVVENAGTDLPEFS